MAVGVRRPAYPRVGDTDHLTTSTLAGLGAAGTAGKIRWVTDGPRGVYHDTGADWVRETGWRVNVGDFDAKFDGTTDDTAALRNAVAALEGLGGGTLDLIPGVAKITGLVEVPGTTESIVINIEGPGGEDCILEWWGATNGTCLRVKRDPRPHFRGFTVSNRVARGTTTGIRLASTTGTGTQGVAQCWDGVLVTGFHIGFWLGDDAADIATSENRFQGITASDCDTGILLEDQNTLDNIFICPSFGQCGTGVQINTGCVQIEGGSASSSTVADISLAGYSLKVSGFRSEGANRAIYARGTNPSTIHIEDCSFAASSNVDAILLDLGNNLQIKIETSTIHGKISLVSLQSVAIILEVNLIGSDALFDFSGVPTGFAGGGYYRSSGNRRTTPGADTLFFPNEEGSFADGVALVAANKMTVTAASPTPKLDTLVRYSSKAGDPTTTEVPAGTYALWENSTTGVLKYWANRGGVLKSVVLA